MRRTFLPCSRLFLPVIIPQIEAVSCKPSFTPPFNMEPETIEPTTDEVAASARSIPDLKAMIQNQGLKQDLHDDLDVLQRLICDGGNPARRGTLMRSALCT